VFKRIPLRERLNLQFRAEAFKHPQSRELQQSDRGECGVRYLGSIEYAGSAGTITETANRERQIQFALRLEF